MKTIPNTPPLSSGNWFHSLVRGKCTREVNEALKEKFEMYIGELPVNQNKNRYSNIIPYDSTRVVLKKDTAYKQNEDYINANYLQFHSSSLKYIATQAPLPNTIKDFWIMAVQTQSPLILVLTKEIEGPKRKLHPYWPSEPEKSLKLENGFEIKVINKEKPFPELVVSELQVYFEGKLIHEITQLRYEGWPDFGVLSQPEDFLSLYNVYQSVLSSAKDKNSLVGPPIVHCSAGVGRTGTFCAIDTALSVYDTWSSESDLILEIVNTFRQQRIFTVQSYTQFCFIYQVINHFISNKSKGS